MDCRTCERLIPLFVEGDLDGSDDDINSHLAACKRCGTLADEFRDSQRWLHSNPLPELDASSLEQMRDDVIGRLKAHAADSPPPFFGFYQSRAWLVAAAVALIFAVTVMAVLIWNGHRTRLIATTSEHSPSIEARTFDDKRSDPASAVALDDSKARDAEGNDGTARPSSKPRRRLATGYRSRRRAHDEGLASVPSIELRAPQSPIADSNAAEQADGAESDMLRIEIQTADPNIRIIWFTPKVITE